MDSRFWLKKMAQHVRLDMNPTAFLAAPLNSLESALNEDVMILSGDQADQFPFTIEDALAGCWRTLNTIVFLMPAFRKAMKDLGHIKSTRLDAIAIYEMLRKRICKTKLMQKTRMNPILLMSFAGDAAESCKFLSRQVIRSNLERLMYEEKRVPTEFQGVTAVHYEDPEETIQAIIPSFEVLESLVAEMKAQRKRPVFMSRWACDLGVPAQIGTKALNGTFINITERKRRAETPEQKEKRIRKEIAR